MPVPTPVQVIPSLEYDIVFPVPCPTDTVKLLGNEIVCCLLSFQATPHPIVKIVVPRPVHLVPSLE